MLQKRLGFLVIRRRGANDNVHAPHLIDLVVVDFRENDVFLQAHGIVATTVEGITVQTAEVLHARQRDRDQAVEEFVHTFLAQRHLGADNHTFAQLEARDGLTGARRQGLLAGDGRQILDRRLDLLGVRSGFADTHVDDDLVELGDLHFVGVAELFLQGGADRVHINRLEARHVSFSISH